MSGLLFHWTGDGGGQGTPDTGRAREIIAEAGHALAGQIERPQFRLYCYARIGNGDGNFISFPEGGFAALAGTLFYEMCTGEEALRRLYARFDGDPQGLADTGGHFCLILGRGDRIWVLRDRNGAYETYADSSRRIISTSFLSLCHCLSRPTLSRQGAYEYVFNGVTLGDETVISQIEKLAVDEWVEYDGRPRRKRHGWSLLPATSTASQAELVENVHEKILNHIQGAAHACKGNVRLALSGGYDSRLLVAMLREAGFAPHLYVYGSATSSDVRIAKHIADAEALSLEHLDKLEGGEPSPEVFPELVRRNFVVGDGIPWGGLFNRGAEHAARRRRHAGGALLLNGGGGEVLRNFFALPDRDYRPIDVARAFYAQFDPDTCTERFDRAGHLEQIAAKMRKVPGLDHDRLPRQGVEALYPHFRCRSWNGRESLINSRFGPWLLPFYDYEVTMAALAVPVRYKYHGDFEAAIIRRADPRLAAYPSNYGTGFDRDAPLARRLRDWAYYLQPPGLRQYRYEIKQRIRRQPTFAKWQDRDHVGRTMDASLPCMSRLVRPERFKDEAQFARVLTLEYLLQTLNAEVD